MEPILLIDFGSTYTKVTAADAANGELLGTAQAYTTVQTDINDGLKKAMAELRERTGELDYRMRLACSSAAGGLRMMASGLVPELTAEAARQASLGAGAKVLRTFSFELTDEDIEYIEHEKPDIFILAGGTDGGNTDCIIHNAEALSTVKADFPIVIAGNRTAAGRCEKLLAGREIYRCDNIMPKFGVLNIAQTQEKIRSIFLRRIIEAKGLSRANEIIDGIMMPTPSAVMDAMKLLSEGIKGNPGIGELVGVDVGGATTDVYSVASGMPENSATVYKGLPEPYVKRTVEGDIGMRYSVHGIVDAAGLEAIAALAGLTCERAAELIESIAMHTDKLPDTDEYTALDEALACMAVRTAVTRHAGRIEEAYTMMGLTYVQTGKDLRSVSRILVTGGSLIHTQHTGKIASFAMTDPADPASLKPKEAKVLVDRKYILAAMGLLSAKHPDAALNIMKKELKEDGTSK